MDNVPPRTSPDGYVHAVSLDECIETLLRVYGPIPEAEEPEEDPLDELDLGLWRWMAHRRLVRVLQLDGAVAFDDLRSRFQRLLSSNKPGEELETAHQMFAERDLWAKNWNLSGDQAYLFRWMVYFEAAYQAFLIHSQTDRNHQLDVRETVERLSVWGSHFTDQELAAFGSRAKPFPWHFFYPAWDPERRRWSDYQSSARAAFERILATHKERQARSHRTSDVEQAPVKRRVEAHFSWYIRYQVLRQSLGRIAEADFATENAVWAAVHSVAKQTDMPLRAGARGGRPKKVASH
jgi:hypothetical protein